MAKVLIVDDDPEIVDMVKDWLANENYTVEALGCGEAPGGPTSSCPGGVLPSELGDVGMSREPDCLSRARSISV